MQVLPMIEGFEGRTARLNDQEMALVPIFAKCLSQHVGKAQAITNAQICKALLDNMGITISGERVRKIIQYIRNNSIVHGLVSYGNKGYAVADCREDVVRGIASIYSRAYSIWHTAEAMLKAEGLTMAEIEQHLEDYNAEQEHP